MTPPGPRNRVNTRSSGSDRSLNRIGGKVGRLYLWLPAHSQFWIRHSLTAAGAAITARLTPLGEAEVRTGLYDRAAGTCVYSAVAMMLRTPVPSGSRQMAERPGWPDSLAGATPPSG